MLPPPLNLPSVSDLKQVNAYDAKSTKLSVEEIRPLWLTEKSAIEQAIDACEGNIPKAAGYLDVSPSTLYRKLQAWKEQ